MWDYNVAAEIDSQFFYSGVPWDMVRVGAIIQACSYKGRLRGLRELLLVLQVARNYTAQTLNLATGKSLTQYDVIAVSAMEAVGVAPAINLHNDMSGGQVLLHNLHLAPSVPIHQDYPAAAVLGVTPQLTETGMNPVRYLKYRCGRATMQVRL